MLYQKHGFLTIKNPTTQFNKLFKVSQLQNQYITKKNLPKAIVSIFLKYDSR